MPVPGGGPSCIMRRSVTRPLRAALADVHIRSAPDGSGSRRQSSPIRRSGRKAAHERLGDGDYLVGAHAFEHLYAHSIPIIILAIITEFELGALSVGAVVAIRSIFGGVTSTAGGFLVDLFHHRVALVLSISTFMIGWAIC